MIQLITLNINMICICIMFSLKSQVGLLAQSVERGADNAKVVSLILTQTTKKVFFYFGCEVFFNL